MKLISLLLFMFLLLSACNRKDKHAVSMEYTCPMHPTVIQDKPGTCPICGMDLVRKGQPVEEVKITAELNYLLKPVNAMIISTIKTITPELKSRGGSAKAQGLITYDTRRFSSIPARFGGRIEKLLIKYNFQPVRKGQKIFEIYSPELLTAQQDLLYLLKSDKENATLISGAKEKLRLLGASDSQIDQWVATGEGSYSFSVYSPVDGYVVEDVVLSELTSTLQPVNPEMGTGMKEAGSSNSIQTSSPQSKSELLTREGMYIRTGQVIFKVINTDQIWAEFDVVPGDAAFININDPVSLTFDNTTDTVGAKVNFVQPFFKSGERFVKVRVYLQNVANKFRIGQLVTASFMNPSGNSLWIPQSARLDLGTQEIAFIKRRGVFRPKEIVTARHSDDWIEVLSGVEAGDSLAYNAQFMVDSESFIRVKN